MTLIHVNLGERAYDIAITSGDLAGLGTFARQRCRGSLAVLVADENVVAHTNAAAAALSAAGFRTAVEMVPAGETSKSLAGAARLYDRLAELQADRKTLVVAVGGGVVGDLAGFAGTTHNRGAARMAV